MYPIWTFTLIFSSAAIHHCHTLLFIYKSFWLANMLCTFSVYYLSLHLLLLNLSLHHCIWSSLSLSVFSFMFAFGPQTMNSSIWISFIYNFHFTPFLQNQLLNSCSANYSLHISPKVHSHHKIEDHQSVSPLIKVG